MADPFEVRYRFVNLLSHLSASTTAATKTANYALKHRDLDEDLHSCILENLEKNNMNNRANIMYFLEHFVEVAKRDGHENYVEMVRRDIQRIVAAVAPTKGPGGGANVKVVRRVVASMGEKGFLGEDVVRSIEDGLKGREGGTGHLLDDAEEDVALRDQDEEMRNEEMVDAPALDKDAALPQLTKAGRESQRATPRGGGQVGSTPTGKASGVAKMDKRVIEQRIEEDRERNKRLRESMWAVGSDDQDEFAKMWEEGSDVGEDDHMIADEEIEERRQAARYSHAED